jgi:hypothetical protein
MMYDVHLTRTPSLYPVLIDNLFSLKERGCSLLSNPMIFEETPGAVPYRGTGSNHSSGSCNGLPISRAS